jgi:hypothetical protein
LVVSRRFRDLIEALDPVPHHYFPADIVLRSGRTIADSHFLFKLGGLIDGGLDASRSTLSPVMRNGVLRYYQSLSLTPNLAWHADRVAGRHIWADALLPRFVVVSDTLYARMKSLGMGDFISKESRLTTA